MHLLPFLASVTAKDLTTLSAPAFKLEEESDSMVSSFILLGKVDDQ